jgi:hypothetical protein
MAAIATLHQEAAGAASLEHELATVLSPSQCDTFSDCSAKWFFKYGIGLPDPKNANLALGIAVDQALSFNFRHKIENLEDLPLQDILAEFDLGWDAVQEETIFRETDSPAELAEKGRGLVELYMKEAARFVEPAAVQKRVEGTIGGVKVQGILDIVEKNGRIRDLKTAAKSPGAVTARQKFQLATYAQLEPSFSGLIQIDTLVKNKTPKLVRIEHTVTDQDIRGTQIQYPLLQEAMRSGYYVPNRTSNLCSRNNCSFWRECEREYGGTVSGGEE